MNNTEITNLFENYIKNWNRKKDLDDSLLETSDKAIWIDNLTNRSKEIREIFANNSDILSSFNALKNSAEDFNSFEDSIADAIYSGICNMYYEDCDDLCVMEIFLDSLLNYYKSKQDYSRVVILLAIKHYDTLDIMDKLSTGVDSDVIIALADELLSYRQYYSDLTVEARRKIFTTYYNSIIVNLDSNKIDIATSYKYMQELLAFWNSPVVQELDKNDERIPTIVGRIRCEWLSFSDHILGTSQEIQDFFISLSQEIYSELESAGTPICEISYEIYSSHVATRCMLGELTWQQGLDILMQYYTSRRSYLANLQVGQSDKLIDMSYEYMDYLYFYINLPQVILNWIKVHNIPPAECINYLRTYLSDLHSVWDELYHNLPPAFLDAFIINVCMSLISYIDDPDEQETWISRLLVKRDITTYIHTTMVAILAKELGNAIMDNAPELFIGFKGMNSIEEISANRDSILTFVQKAAYYHDIGKARIGQVINIQTRRITDWEFGIIKNHPSHGSIFSDMSTILSEYKDVIVGHHKTYDGKAGYPSDFDNTTSPIRPVIDLITICDSIDAATDILGRNYTSGKTSDAVIQEIIEQKGTRYNPDMADFIGNSEELQRRISEITTTGRIDCYYNIYDNYMKETNN